MIRLKDVAREAGVSPQTVSNFFNRPDLIKDETKQKVGEAVRKLGYTPNASARRLRTKRSNTLAIGISPNSQSPVFDKLLHSLATEAGLLSMRILLYKADSQQDELEHYKALCAGEDVDAFILTNTVHNDPRPGWLTKHNQEFVLFGRPWGNRNLYDPHIAWVDVDGRKGIREITQRLILTGHRQIGFLGWPSKSGTGDDRFAGWKDAVTQAKLMPTKELDAFSRRTATDIRSGEEAAFHRRPRLRQRHARHRRLHRLRGETTRHRFRQFPRRPIPAVPQHRSEHLGRGPRAPAHHQRKTGGERIIEG